MTYPRSREPTPLRNISRSPGQYLNIDIYPTFVQVSILEPSLYKTTFASTAPPPLLSLNTAAPQPAPHSPSTRNLKPRTSHIYFYPLPSCFGSIFSLCARTKQHQQPCIGDASRRLHPNEGSIFIFRCDAHVIGVGGEGRV